MHAVRDSGEGDGDRLWRACGVAASPSLLLRKASTLTNVRVEAFSEMKALPKVRADPKCTNPRSGFVHFGPRSERKRGMPRRGVVN